MKSIIRNLIFASAFSFVAVKSSAQFTLSVGISINTPPPPLPVYTQPPCPTDGFLWSPGYWAYDEVDGYYWVPGVWVRPPMVGYLWTPGYWGFGNGIYGWHAGYWGAHIGFYGVGFVGGAWQGGYFRYNTAVVNVNTTVVRNVYVDRTVINNTTVINNRASFNGAGGVSAQPTPQEQAVMHENHVQPTSEQFSHNQTASRDRNQFASVNNGRPSTTAMNTVGGARFNNQGRNAPPPVSRPAGGLKPNASNMNRNTAATNNHPQQVQPGNHHVQPNNNNNRPVQPKVNPHPQAHPQQHPQARKPEEPNHHKER